MNTKTKTALISVLGVICIVIGLVYAVKPADQLPTFFPGHDLALTTHHIKHALAAILLGFGAFIWAWFTSGSEQSGK